MIAPATKLCRTCIEYRPVTQFRRRSRNSDVRQKECNDCRNAKDRAKRRAKRDKQFQRFTGSANRARSAGEFETLCMLMIEGAGGFERFCNLYWESLEAARQRNPGSRYVLNALQFIMKLHMHAEDMQLAYDERFGRDADRMTDEELEEKWELAVEAEACRRLELMNSCGAGAARNKPSRSALGSLDAAGVKH